MDSVKLLGNKMMHPLRQLLQAERRGVLRSLWHLRYPATEIARVNKILRSLYLNHQIPALNPQRHPTQRVDGELALPMSETNEAAFANEKSRIQGLIPELSISCVIRLQSSPS